MKKMGWIITHHAVQMWDDDGDARELRWASQYVGHGAAAE